MQFGPDGAQHFPAALGSLDLDRLEAALLHTIHDRPGVRLTGIPALSELLAAHGPVGRLAAGHLGPAAKPVRALFFNKTADQNWSLG